MRRTVLDFRKSRIPAVLGACAADVPRLCGYINEAIERLILAGDDSGWWGTWYRTVFNVTRSDPYITCGREIARVQAVAVCGQSIPIRNQFYEFLEAGIGPQPPNPCVQDCCDTVLQTFERGTYPTMVDLPSSGGPYKLIAYPTDNRDVGKRVFASGLDKNGRVVRNTEGLNEVAGEYITLAMPYSVSIAEWSSLSGIQKDVTYRDVQLSYLNTSDGSITVMSTYAPDETCPAYRRYYIGNLPDNCCGTSGSTIQVQAMAKLEFVPVSGDSDYLLIGNIPALKEECESVRYGEMDNPTAIAMAERKHMHAIRLLNQEIKHYQGVSTPAIGQPLWGTAALEYQSIGKVI